MAEGKEEEANRMKAQLPYRTLTGNYAQRQLAGINCFQNYLKAVIDSDYARDFNPFEAYFAALFP